MCLVLIAFESHPRFSIILAANRDEFYDRPTAAAAFWPEAPAVLAGRDLRASGTWLGIDRAGRFAAVTNYRQGEREPAAPRSRGRLVSDFLTSGMDARMYLKQVAREAEQYNGFNLLVGDTGQLWYFSNREGRIRGLSPRVYGLSNHLLDSPWPKVTAGKHALGALLLEAAPELGSGLLRLLSDRHQSADHLLPTTGVGLAWERLLSSAFISSPDYGTRSSTAVLVAHDGRVSFIEQSFGPGGTPAGQAHYEFALGGSQSTAFT
ncbi:MAG TPA: NRDE family protein [Gemmatimonadales bacterium]|nr:NRDE family protein [Gemmatimonadales bacterium]